MTQNLGFNFLYILMIDDTVTCSFFQSMVDHKWAFGIKGEKAKERKAERDSLCVYVCVFSRLQLALGKTVKVINFSDQQTLVYSYRLGDQ